MRPLPCTLTSALAVLLVWTVLATPAEAGQRQTTRVGGWKTAPTSIPAGSAVSTRIRVRSGGRTADRKVVLQHRRWGRSWHPLDRRRTGSNGRTRVRGVPPTSGQLRLLVRGTGTAKRAVTSTRTVRVSRGSRRADRLTTEVVDRVNRLRKAGTHCGGRWQRPVPRLRHDDRLAAAAQTYARRMAKHRFFGHRDRVTGAGPDVRATAAGYDWEVVGENLAAGYASPRRVVAQWRKSPGHCRNLMDPRWKHLGVGWYDGGPASRWGHYWGQLFGKPDVSAAQASPAMRYSPSRKTSLSCTESPSRRPPLKT